DVHPGAREDRLPVDQLGGARPAVPRPPFERVRLELEEIALQRLLEAAQRCFDALGRPAQGRLPSTGGRGLRVAAGPAFEQAAERERRDLTRAQLRDQPARSRRLRRALVEELRPGGAGHTSTRTG